MAKGTLQKDLKYKEAEEDLTTKLKEKNSNVMMEAGGERWCDTRKKSLPGKAGNF